MLYSKDINELASLKKQVGLYQRKDVHGGVNGKQSMSIRLFRSGIYLTENKHRAYSLTLQAPPSKGLAAMLWMSHMYNANVYYETKLKGTC